MRRDRSGARAVAAPSPESPSVRTVSQILGDVAALHQITSESIVDCERRVKEANDELHALYVTREGLSNALGRNTPGAVAMPGTNYR